MKLSSLIRPVIFVFFIASLWIMNSCNVFNEDLPECRLYVKFKYDYNMSSVDKFSTQVDKVTLYIFDKDGLFLFKQTDEGSKLAANDYRMEINLPVGQYMFMAWAGIHESYEVSQLQEGSSNITDMKLRLKRDNSLIINKELEPLWYGEIINVNFTGTANQIETINLIKDTNKFNLIFKSASANSDLPIDNYEYKLLASNGYLNYDNSLLDDDILSYQPYYKEQQSNSVIAVELNTMRLMANRDIRFIVTEKSSGNNVLNIDLIDYLLKTEMEGYTWSLQEYLDRQDEYEIIFIILPPNPNVPHGSWLTVQISINGWTYHSQTGGTEL